jgi:hypothetical protein
MFWLTLLLVLAPQWPILLSLLVFLGTQLLSWSLLLLAYMLLLLLLLMLTSQLWLEYLLVHAAIPTANDIIASALLRFWLPYSCSRPCCG